MTDSEDKKAHFYRCPEESKFLKDQCLYKSYKGDFFPDCSDEKILDEEKSVYDKYQKAWSFDRWRHYNQPIKEIMMKCFEKDVEKGIRAPCSNNMVPHSCFVVNQVCILDINPAGHFKGCRSGALLQKCETFQCPNMFKCPGAYCVEATQVCDGVRNAIIVLCFKRILG